jgi:hypothetical protein
MFVFSARAAEGATPTGAAGSGPDVLNIDPGLGWLYGPKAAI